jgi:hypothetical protein
VVAWYFYWRATKDLKEETAKLRKLYEITLYALFNRNAQLEPVYDKDGNLSGFAVLAVGGASGSSGAKGDLRS